eukprot:CAMPEP_0172511484 /NCGR_PEP_ID=MMETSP1066-20121228/236800_1 /TAXON_ID=671091 /ORGANISM="Coscinodiscus wailesii, Strain CCMP2513" /LENGTH=180 /DNA_ID=CAMNT_0013290875 /DNA_START=140 /DNA_END=679 /DNA_ORIENTATION=-
MATPSQEKQQTPALHASTSFASLASLASLNSLLFVPSAPPPACAPPIPPESTPRNNVNYGTTTAGNAGTTCATETDPLVIPAARTGGVNTGRRNSTINIPKVTFLLRVINLTCCTLAILLEFPALIFKIFTPDRLVLAFFLVSFSVILCAFELHLPPVARTLRDNCGFIYHPVGRAVLLF